VCDHLVTEPFDQDILERVDCRHLDICSVDPPGCTDIDDALHARVLPNGNYEVSLILFRSFHIKKQAIFGVAYF